MREREHGKWPEKTADDDDDDEEECGEEEDVGFK